MKRFVLCLFGIFICLGAIAETITINWLNENKTISSTSTCTIGGDVVMPNTTPTKRGYTFRGYVDNYTPVEYIEGTGSQWIDTGYNVNQNTNIKTKVIFTVVKMAVYIFGNGSAGSKLTLVSSPKSSNIVYTFQRAGSSTLTDVNMNRDVPIEIETNKIAIAFSENGVTSGATSGTDNVSFSGSSMYIFSASGASNNASMKLYYFQIYNNDVLVRDFIPVVDSKGTACLYDRIEHKFYYNAGSGEFNAGPSI